MIETDLFSRKIKPRILGQRIQHSWAEAFFLDQILYAYRFDSLIELGTAAGGLSLMFGVHALRTGARAVTFDVRREPLADTYKVLKPLLPLDFYQLDVLTPHPRALRIIKRYINRGRTLLYCDAGGGRKDKPRQIRLYAPLLKPGDVIMAHDLGIEIQRKDVDDMVEECDLKPFHQDEIDKLGGGILSFAKA